MKKTPPGAGKTLVTRDVPAVRQPRPAAVVKRAGMVAQALARAEPLDLSVSQVAERTGVPIATIKYYIREGLLPRPRTEGRTVGRYDEPFIQRLEIIRELRNRRRLSILEIRVLMQQLGENPSLTEVELRLAAQERLDAAIDPTHALPPVPAERLVERSGLQKEDVRALERHGLLTPVRLDGAVVYAERDARIAEVVGALRLSGYNDQLGFTIADLAKYVEGLRAIVVREVEQFDKPELRALRRDLVLQLIEQGVSHIDVLLGLLHKKLLLTAVHDWLDAVNAGRDDREARGAAVSEPAEGKRRRR